MEGTLTYHLPLKRGPQRPPMATLVVRRVGEEEWQAGLTVCSRGDQFVKRIGRRVALHRLAGKPLVETTAEKLLKSVIDHLVELEARRPGTVPAKAVLDLPALLKPISKMRIE